MTKQRSIKAVLIFLAIPLLAVVFGLLGMILGPFGAMFGFALGLAGGIAAFRETVWPEKYAAYEVKCPVCGASTKVLPDASSGNCHECRGRFVVISRRAYTPEQAKSVRE